MIKSGSVCIAYETVEKADRSLPLLIPMSEVAGRMSIQEGKIDLTVFCIDRGPTIAYAGAKYLEKPMGGRGILLGGVPGVKPAEVLVLGGGVVGTQAAKIAAGFGARVTIMDVNLPRLRQLDDILPPNVSTLYSNDYNIREACKSADLIIGSVLIPGAKAPKLITREMLSLMKEGAVIVDVAIDQGGCFETSRPTTHQDPTFVVDGVGPAPPTPSPHPLSPHRNTCVLSTLHARRPQPIGDAAAAGSALLRRQHARRGALHLHARPHQRHPPLRPPPRRPGVANCLRCLPRAARRAERRARPRGAPQGGGGVGPRLRRRDERRGRGGGRPPGPVGRHQRRLSPDAAARARATGGAV
jgi:hypothetical protein